MIDKGLLKRRIDTYNNLISRLDRMTSANYMHIVAGMRCTLKAMIDNNLAIIDSTQENPCEGCTNRKGCVTCENGELKETELSHSKVTKISDQEEPVSEELEEAAKKAATQTIGGVEKFFWNDYYRFKAGAQWQKQQMMKNAVDGLVCAQLTTSGEIMIRSNYFKSETLDYLDKVKLIIIKED